MSPSASLAIIIPVYKDADALAALLAQLRTAHESGVEIIVVGTHDDNSSEPLARREATQYIAAQRGRGAQLAAGALATKRDLLWFLHADSKLPENAVTLVCDALAKHPWGRFDVRFDDPRTAFRVVAAMMNWRSRATRIATGDQGIFVRRVAYETIGGFAPLLLMEDIDFSKRLRRSPASGAPACIPTPIVVSARKWQREGIVKTILRMWWWRFQYWRGVSPDVLVRDYYRDRSLSQ
jgi:rSAM/selenodomain-associated transferase 2